MPTNSLSADATGDVAFMASVLLAIQERHGENAIRSKFRRWILKFTRLAAVFEEMVYGASALWIGESSPKPAFTGDGSPETNGAGLGDEADLPPEVQGHGYVWPSPQLRQQELAANATRIEGWRNSRSYYNFVRDLATAWPRRPVRRLDLQHLHDKLSKLRLTPEASANIYLAICAAVRTERQVSQLLAVIVSGGGGGGGQGGGLFYLGLGLFHGRRDVREAVAELMGRVGEHEAGRLFWRGVGGFVRGAWERVVAARVARGGEEGVGG